MMTTTATTNTTTSRTANTTASATTNTRGEVREGNVGIGIDVDGASTSARDMTWLPSAS
jgi:hypothetical protein